MTKKATLVVSILGCVAVALIAPGVAHAQNITPVGVTASSTFTASYQAEDLINDSGLSGGLHDVDFTNMWLSNERDVTPWLIFDLGAVYNLSSASIWQYNATCCGLERGIQGLRILLSTDGSAYTLVTTTTLAQSTGGNIPAQVVVVTGTARYVRFEATSNYGDAAYTGLSEVKFTGEEAALPDPIPAAGPWGIALLALVLASLGFVALHRRA